jgi:TP901 family phage tail tape measure protein
MASRDTVLRFVYETTGDQELANTAGSLVKMADQGKLADAEAQALASSLKNLAAQSKAVNDALSQKAALAETTTQLAAAKAAVTALNTEFDRTDTSSKKVTAAFAAADKAVASLTTKQNLQAAALAKTEGSLQKAGLDTTNLAAASTQLNEKSAALAGTIKTVGDKTAESAAGTKKAADATKDLGDKSKDAGGILAEFKTHLVEIVSIATAVELALKGIEFGSESFKGAAAVEQSLARVKAIAQSTGEDFQKLSEQIDAAAAAANVSSTAAAQAAAELAAQGESAGEIFQTLIPTLLLAKDAQIEVGEAAAIVDDALDLFGKKAGDAALVVDQLVAASKGSKDGIAGLATALRSLAPDAQQLGLSFEQLVGLLGLMGQNGIDAGKAAKGLRTIFQDLENPTSKFSLALHQLGDSSGNFSKAIDTLRTSGKNGQDALLSLDGAARSLVLFLLQQAPGAVDTFTASLANAGGTAERTAKTIDDTLSGSFTSFTNALDRLGEGLLSTSLEPFRVELQKLADQLTAFAKSEDFETLKASLGKLFDDGTKAFDNFISHLDWNQLVDGAEKAVTEAGKSIAELKDNLASVATVLNTIGASIGVVFRAVAVVFDLAKVAISGTEAALTSVTLAASRQIDKLTGSTSQVTIALEAIQQAASDAAGKGLDALRENSDKVVGNLEKLGGVADETGKKIDTLNNTFKNVKGGAETVSDTSGNLVSDFNAVTGAVENSANAFGILPELFNATANAENLATAAAKAHADQITAAQKNVDDARAALDKLIQSGNTSARTFQDAANAYKTAQDQLAALTGKTDEAAESQRKLSQAFTDLKIKSQDDLKTAAEGAAKNLDIIKQAFLSGKVPIEDLQRAFAAYAQTVKAQVADSSAAVQQQAQTQLDAQASALGLQTVIIAAGAAGKKAGDDTAKAFDGAKDKIDEAKGSADEFGDAAKSAQEKAAAAANQSGAAFGAVIALNNDQVAAMKALNEQLSRGVTYQTLDLTTAKNVLEQIGPLIGAGAQVLQQRLDDLNAAAEHAQEVAKQMADQADSIQDQIDQLTGNDQDIEDRRHDNALENIEDEAKLNGTLNTAEYNRLVSLENQLHQLKLQNIQKEKKANADASGGGGSSESGGPPGSSSVPGRGDQSNTNSQPAPAPAPNNASAPRGAPSVTVNVQGSVIGADPAKLGEQLARLVRPQLDRLNANRF